MIEAFFQGFSLLVRVDTYIYICLGLAVGMFVGAMPGLTTTLTMAILLPVSFKLEPMLGIPFLIGIYKGGIYGGSISAILVGIPGTGASIATTFDGPALTRKGQGRKALEMALYASVTGDTLSDIFTLSMIGPIALVVLMVGPPEVFAIIIFSLVLIASVSSESGLKGAIAACIGLGLGLIGTDAATGATRLTFGLEILSAGIPIIPLVIGIFAVPEVLEAVQSRAPRFIDEHIDLSRTGERLRWPEFRRSIRTILRSTVIGTGIGMVPGVGQVVAAFISYSAAKRASDDPDSYGKGNLDGIAAPEAANNAVNGPTLVPLLTLGIPGDNITAILLGAFVAHGMRPGPAIFEEQGPLMYALLLTIVFANILFLFLGYVLLKPFAYAIQAKKAYLVPIILGLAFVGTLSTGVYTDVMIMIVVGICSFILRKLRFDLAPLVIAFVLSEPIEYRLAQTMLYAKGSLFHYVFVQRPVASLFLSAAIIWTGYLVIRPWLNNRKQLQGA
ncbi:MAG: tripartite tricarboxylate transporter permease [Nitrospinota bacterium]|jgi:putative tricarboxylic transport membrane protein|nr:tripartite tricarboxylate transporter permease [Nitrospinota bacterium]MDP7167969.1 tripartite tricarboxylate transporter permease [Nitrospinota bacterium]